MKEWRNLMNDSISFGDLLLFLREQKKKICYGFFLSLIILVFFIFYSFISSNDVKMEDREVESISFILENNQGSVISNTGVVKSILVRSFIKNSKANDMKEQEEIKKATSVTFDTTTSVMTVTVDNSELSKGITNLSETFFEYLSNEELKYFENKELYMMDDHTMKNTIENTGNSTSFISRKRILVYILLWFFTGISISSIFIAWKTYKDKFIANKFYLSNKTINIDLEKFKFASSNDEYSELKSIINSPAKNKFIVSENEIEIDDNLEYIFFTKSLSEVREAPFFPCEIVIICNKNLTSKNWYNLQLELSKNYNVKMKSVFISGQ